MARRKRWLVTCGAVLAVLTQGVAMTRSSADGPKPGDGAAAEAKQGDSLAAGDGELGRATVWLFDRGAAVSGKRVNADDAKALVGALEKAVRESRAEARGGGGAEADGDGAAAREKVLRSGWAIELRYDTPVRQRELGFVSPDLSRLFTLNRFVIPLGGEYAVAKAGGQARQRFFPYEVIKTREGRTVVRDWAADHDVVVYSTADVREVERILAGLGVDMRGDGGRAP